MILVYKVKMAGLFGIVFFIALVGLIVGLIKPKLVIRWGGEGKKNRKRVLLYYGLAIFISLVLIGLTAEPSEQEDEKSTEQIEVEAKEDNEKAINKDTQDVVEASAVEEPEEVAIDIETDVDAMVDVLNENALRAERDYQDKVILLTGKFASVDSDGKYFSLAPINDEWSFDKIRVGIENETQRAQAMNVDKDETVSVIVMVDDIGEFVGYSGKCIKILDVSASVLENISSDANNYFQVDCGDLTTEIENNALKAEQKYQDTYLEITGLLSNIDSDGNYFSLAPSNGEFTMVNVQCYIDDSMIDTLINYNTGEKIVVRGKIDSIGEVMGYSIDVIEIVE